MITWFCPECFAELPSASPSCLQCGARWNGKDAYEHKLVQALDHRLSDRRVLAARILGELRSETGVSRLAALAEERLDPYLAAEAARALARIDPTHPAVLHIARSGPVLSRTAVREGLRWR